MVAVAYDLDIIGRADLPGELHEKPVWEEAVEADCGLCGRGRRRHRDGAVPVLPRPHAPRRRLRQGGRGGGRGARW